MYEQLVTTVQSYEEKIIRRKHPSRFDRGVALGLKVPLTPADAAFLVEEIYRGRSAVSGVATRLRLVRWEVPEGDTLLWVGEGSADEQKSAVLRLSDLVCMTKEEATRHEKEVIIEGKSVRDVYDAEVLERVRARQEEARGYEEYVQGR